MTWSLSRVRRQLSIFLLSSVTRTKKKIIKKKKKKTFELRDDLISFEGMLAT